jgi:hypothetical protein
MTLPTVHDDGDEIEVTVYLSTGSNKVTVTSSEKINMSASTGSIDLDQNGASTRLRWWDDGDGASTGTWWEMS